MMGLFQRVLSHSLMRYLVVGGLSFALNVVLFNVFVEVIGWSRAPSGPVAFLLTFFVSYTLQRTFAFRSEADIAGSMIRYLVLVVINTLVQYPMHWLAEREGLGLLTSQLVATAVTTVWNYFAYKHWVYVDRSHPLPPDEETVAWHERAGRAAPNSSVLSQGAVAPAPRSPGTAPDRGRNAVTAACLSVVVPAHNSGDALRRTVSTLATVLTGRGEVIVVENGSTDGTWLRAQAMGKQEWPVPVVVCRSVVGLGEAYGEGLRRATGDIALLTADDLPFDVSDIQAWEAAGRPAGLVVGSKAHPDSAVERVRLRRILTFVFTVLRRIVLSLPVGDTQGTIFVPTEWARTVLPRLREGGYLFSTELLYAAHLQGLPITEVPVCMQPRQEAGGTRIRISDVWEMAAGLVRLRRRRHELSA